MESCTKKTDLTGLVYLSLLPLLGLLISLIPMNSNAVVELPFLDNSPYTKMLAFSGFPDCATACPLSLSTLRETYIDYQETTQKHDLGVTFVNIRRDMPQSLSDSYVENFHKDFKAYSTKTGDTKTFYTSLGLKTFDVNEQINSHQGFIYLFTSSNKQWRIEKIFQNNVDKQTLLDHLSNHTG